MSNDIVFVREGEFERGVAIYPGHERKIEGKNDYGIRYDDWVFVLRDAEHAATLDVSSRALNGRLGETPESIRRWHDDYRRQHGYAGSPPWALRGTLNICTSYPTEVDSVRKGSVPAGCVFQVSGGHFSFENTCLGANPLVLGLDKAFVGGPPAWWLEGPEIVRARLFEEELGVWGPLEERLREARDRARAVHAALPTQCSCCKGEGVVPKGEAR
jgi:hypothetical protein